jgi:bifunctional DNA-binding transcriptional regulator/antitoxin component of YhaV-PrlF toxin-antitoxin module
MMTMLDSITVQVTRRGLLTLPKALRVAYNIREGDQMTLLDLGGVFVLSPRSSEIDRMVDEIRKTLIEQGESLESMLQSLREARQRYES